MFVAFAVGLLTGLFFRPITLVPVSVLFLLTAAAAWTVSGDWAFSKILTGLGYLVILNVGFLAGAILRRLWATRGKGPSMAI